MDEYFKKLRDTECPKDYKKRHYWKELGVIHDGVGETYLLWRCSQCGKALPEKLEFIAVSGEQ